MKIAERKMIYLDDAIRLAEQGQIQGFPWQFEQLVKLPSAQPEQRWIPVSERPPEESGFYNVSVINMHDRAYTKSAYYNKDHDCWHAKQKIVAWMPLLEPYRGEE